MSAAEERLSARRAEYADIAALKELWAETFGDGQEYIDLFFDRMFRPSDYIVLCRDPGTEAAGPAVISMAALLPVKLVYNGERYPVAYLYAMATRASERGKGFGLRLLSFAEEYCRAQGKAGIALQPADEGLVSFYSKAGYKPAFSGIRSSVCYMEYDPLFLDFARDAGYDVPAAEDPQRSVPGVFLSFDPGLQPKKGYLPYPLD